MALYLIAFALLHSIIVSLPFKRRLLHLFGPSLDRWYLPAFNIMSFITISPLVVLLLLFPGRRIYTVPSPWRWLMVAGQILATWVTSRAFKDGPQRFSIRAMLAPPGTPGSKPLDPHGIYRYVRDPFLISGLANLWLTPLMTTNLLMIYILTSIYLFLGSIHWEKRLLYQFGDDYRRYQRAVSRIMPGLDYCRSGHIRR